MSPTLRIGAPLLVAALVSVPALAWIPDADKITQAIAESNRMAGRGKPLWFDVSLSIGGSEPVATGVLATHPTGLARLELRSQRGFVERHLLQGSAYSASRDGELLEDRHRPFLPPVFLLQATSAVALRAALESFGVASSRADLGHVDEHDCYVLGGRLPTAGGGETRLPSMWVDLVSFDVVRIDRSDGVRFRLGPTQVFEGGIRAPGWIRIEAPGAPPARLDVDRVVPANAPAAAFSMSWLTAAPGP